MGANFCHVIKIKLLYQSKLSITLGNQKWKGAAPILNISVIQIIKIDKLIFNFIIKLLLINKI